MMTDSLEKIIKMFESATISDLELELDNMKLKLSKQGVKYVEGAPLINNEINSKSEEITIDPNNYIKAPVVGTFYAQRAEGEKPFVAVGDKVKKGTVLCIIEAMKVMNEVVASKDGVIKEILVNNGDLVEFNQNIMVIGD